MDNKKFDDNYKHEEVVDKESLSTLDTTGVSKTTKIYTWSNGDVGGKDKDLK